MTHFFLTAKGIGQMMAEKRASSEANKAKHTGRSAPLVRLSWVRLTRVVELRVRSACFSYSNERARGTYSHLAMSMKMSKMK